MPPDTTSETTAGPLAERLLDAQVAFHLDRLAGPDGTDFVAGLVDALLDAYADRPLVEVVDVDQVRDAVARALAGLAGSSDDAAVHAVAAMVREVARDVARAGPVEPYPLGEVVDRERVESVVDAGLALTPALERALGELADSPLVGAMATRFMARIAGEALQANQAVAEKVPAIGGLLSLGASLASSVATGAIGAADKQLDGLLGETVGKGGTYAVGRLNRVVVETLRDPTTREALLQVWDLVAAQEVRGLGDRHDAAAPDEVAELAGAVRTLVASVLAHPHTVALAHQVVDTVVEGYGGHTLPELLEELEVDRGVLAAAVAERAPGLLRAWRESGALERWLRAELAPFYRSAEVAALLDR